MIVTLAVAVSPIASVAVPVTFWLAPSVFRVWGPGQETGGAPPEQENVTVTGVLFQPAELDAGEAVATICKGGNGWRVN